MASTSISFSVPNSAIIPKISHPYREPLQNSLVSVTPLCPLKRSLRCLFISPPSCLQNPTNIDEGSNPEGLVEDLRVPDSWLVPSKAVQESEWLRVTLHKWLDDEYCPEATNVDISSVAARSYYESLVAKQSDLAGILLKMARDLESISYQESFHGAFSSANAAVHLISLRIAQK